MLITIISINKNPIHQYSLKPSEAFKITFVIQGNSTFCCLKISANMGTTNCSMNRIAKNAVNNTTTG